MLHVKGIKPLLTRCGSDDDTYPPRQRWVVERTIAWLHQFRRLRVRYELRSDIHKAFISLGCVLISFKKARFVILLVAQKLLQQPRLPQFQHLLDAAADA